MVLPRVWRSIETTRPEKAHDRPEVDHGGCEQDRNQAQTHRNQARVDGVIALAYAGEVQTARMRYEECDEGQQGAHCCGCNAVPQHANPRVNLSDFFPPVVLNDE